MGERVLRTQKEGRAVLVVDAIEGMLERSDGGQCRPRGPAQRGHRIDSAQRGGNFRRAHPGGTTADLRLA